MDIVLKYFPDLTFNQIQQFSELYQLYKYWNEKINVISRKDIDNLYERHILHSLAIFKLIQFKPGSNILDVGTGGGFPGIPLAIMCPDVNFFLIDSTQKKITVVKEVSRSIQLSNVIAQQMRVENVKSKYDFVVSRAVTSFPEFYKLVYKLISDKNKNEIKNGILYLKGGDFMNEMKEIKKHYKIIEIKNFFIEEFFESKKIIYVY